MQLRRYSKSWLVIAPAALAASAALGVLTAHWEHAQANASDPLVYPHELAEIPSYPGATFYPMGESLQVDGLRRVMAYALTKDSLPAVAEHYQDAWRALGMLVQKREAEGQVVLSASDPADPVQRTVLVQETERGDTAIVASVSRKLESAPPRRTAVPARCEVQTEHGARDAGGLVTEAMLLRCAMHLREVIAFYDSRLDHTELTVLEEPTIDRKSTQRSYSARDLQVNLVASQPESQPPTTLVTLSWQERVR